MLLKISRIINFKVLVFLFLLVPVISTGVDFFKEITYKAKTMIFLENPPSFFEKKNRESGGFLFTSGAGFQYAGFNISELSVVTLLFVIVMLLVILLLLNRDRIRLKMDMNKYLARDHDRQIIAKDLHDNVGAQLSAARMFLCDVRKHTTRGKDEKLLDGTMELLETSIRDLRSLLVEWQNSELGARNYLTEMEKLAGEVKRTHNIQFELSFNRTGRYLNPFVGLTLSRITKEFVDNTVKYAGASTVIIDLIMHPGKLVFTYEDNGIGFDTAKVPYGYGLSGIESRILSMDGYLEINSSPGEGFMALLEIPLENELKATSLRRDRFSLLCL